MPIQEDDGIVVRVPHYLVTPGRFKLQVSVELSDSDTAAYPQRPQQDSPQRSFRTTRTSDRPDASADFYSGTPYARPQPRESAKGPEQKGIERYRDPDWPRMTSVLPPTPEPGLEMRNKPRVLLSEYAESPLRGQFGTRESPPGSPENREKNASMDTAKLGLPSPNSTVLPDATGETALTLHQPRVAKPAPFTTEETKQIMDAIRQGRPALEIHPKFPHLSKDQFKMRYWRLKKKMSKEA